MLPKEVSQLIKLYLYQYKLDLILNHKSITDAKKADLVNIKTQNIIVTTDYLINWLGQVIDDNLSKTKDTIKEFEQRQRREKIFSQKQQQYNLNNYKKSQYTVHKLFVYDIRRLEQKIKPITKEIEYKLITLTSANQNEIFQLVNYGSIYQLLKYLKLNSIKHGNLISFKGKELYTSSKSYDKTYNIYFWHLPFDRLELSKTIMVAVFADLDMLKSHFSNKSKYEIKTLYAPALDQDYEMNDDY